MFPRPPLDNVADLAFADLKFRSKEANAKTVDIPKPNQPCNIFGFKFGSDARFSRRMTVPALFHHVLNIVLGIAKPKVIRVDTPRVVACVQHPHTEWNCTPINNPRCSMRAHRFVAAGSGDPAVSLGSEMGTPKPTCVSLFNLGPKALRKRFGQSLRREVFRGKLWLHNQFIWLCHALGCSKHREGISITTHLTLKVKEVYLGY